jgi:uncharacterized membrane protein
MVFGRDLFSFRHGLIAFCLLLGLAWLPATPAFADLRVCNQTSDPVSIALGYRAERGWQSEGWWVAPPAKCATVFQGALDSRFFYLFAADDIGGGAWDGSVFMCTRDESFTIFGVEDCLARGYERTGFFEVDTQNRSDWMLELTDNDAAGGANANGADAPSDQVVPLGSDTQDTVPLGDGEVTEGADGGDDGGVDAE